MYHSVVTNCSSIIVINILHWWENCSYGNKAKANLYLIIPMQIALSGGLWTKGKKESSAVIKKVGKWLWDLGGNLFDKQEKNNKKYKVTHISI